MTDQTEPNAHECVTARDAAADEAPVRASDPRSLTIDRGCVAPASQGASDDAAAAADRHRPDA